MQQTPAHERHNADLLAVIPLSSARLIEIGCSSGALAREYKKLNPACHYTGIDICRNYADAASAHCDVTLSLDIESIADSAFEELFPSDCWVFGDSLEHLRDPWSILRKIRGKLRPGACIAACIPNAQHWSVQVRLNSGNLFYEDSGLLDRTHLRWFTRTTIIDLFKVTGFRIEAFVPRIFHEPQRERVADAIRMMSRLNGADPEQAVLDAMALQYVVRAVPA